jgi:hypothetical protein
VVDPVSAWKFFRLRIIEGDSTGKYYEVATEN